MLKRCVSLIAFSLLLASGVTSADANPCSNCPCFTPHLYAEGQAGYSFSDWKTSLDNAFQPLTPVEEGTTIINHKSFQHRNGFAGGGDIGYQFNPYVALEFGGFACRKIDYESFTQSTTETDVKSSRNKGTITNWSLYSAAKLNWSPRCISDLNIFAKFGVVFRYGRIKNKNISFDSATTSEKTRLSQGPSMSFPSAIAGGGFQYWIYDGLSINVEYLYLPASVGTTTEIDGFNHFRFPHTHIVTGSICIKFL
jgi:opacity protein-like surface antigen